LISATAAARSARRDEIIALAAGLVTVLLWGSAFVAIRAAGQSLSPATIGLGRLLVSSAILGVVALVRREPLPSGRDILAIAAYGVLWLGVYSITLNAAERLVDAGTAAMIINIGPILIAIGAGVFLREGFPARLFTGCLTAFAGCVVIGVGTVGTASSSVLGMILCFVAACAYAAAVVVQKPVLARVSPFQVTWIGCAAATVACLPFVAVLANDASSASGVSIGWMVYLGAGPTALGFATWAVALQRTSAGRMASIAYLIPVVAIILGWLVLGETPPFLATSGGILCLAGVLVARRRPHDDKAAGAWQPGWPCSGNRSRRNA
jgi:drug/metabolite transporter (DMT)-like permease